MAADSTTLLPYRRPTLGHGPAAEGRRAALRSFNADLLSLDGDAQADLARVMSGAAPQEFKDAFAQTLTALSDLFDPTFDSTFDSTGEVNR